jgi:hypothetical protein
MTYRHRTARIEGGRPTAAKGFNMNERRTEKRPREAAPEPPAPAPKSRAPWLTDARPRTARTEGGSPPEPRGFNMGARRALEARETPREARKDDTGGTARAEKSNDTGRREWLKRHGYPFHSEHGWGGTEDGEAAAAHAVAFACKILGLDTDEIKSCQWAGLKKDAGFRGAWNPATRTLKIATDIETLDTLAEVVAHEVVHAWQTVTDRFPPKHQQTVAQNYACESEAREGAKQIRAAWTEFLETGTIPEDPIVIGGTTVWPESARKTAAGPLETKGRRPAGPKTNAARRQAERIIDRIERRQAAAYA